MLIMPFVHHRNGTDSSNIHIFDTFFHVTYVGTALTLQWMLDRYNYTPTGVSSYRFRHARNSYRSPCAELSHASCSYGAAHLLRGLAF